MLGCNSLPDKNIRLPRVPWQWLLIMFALCSGLQSAAEPLPVRGILLFAPKQADVPLFVRFITDALPKEGVNTLVLNLNYHYQFTSHPEVRETDSLSKSDLQSIAEACRRSHIHLIPLIDLLGSQSWHDVPRGLLRSHPEFDELSSRHPCSTHGCNHSYCPLHPGVHKIVFDLIDEVMDVTGADTFHAGMDEVYLIGEDLCPRCHGKDKAELFANEVRAIHDHLALSHRKMWMWGDRLLNNDRTGISTSDASGDGTDRALYLIPTDIVICDWHYFSAPPTVAYFATAGFAVVSSPWTRSDIALAQLEFIQTVRQHSNPLFKSRMAGVLQTAFADSGAFIRAYYGEKSNDPHIEEAVACSGLCSRRFVAAV